MHALAAPGGAHVQECCAPVVVDCGWRRMGGRYSGPVQSLRRLALYAVSDPGVGCSGAPPKQFGCADLGTRPRAFKG
eukprot:4961111-Alexandrium_andersonii.AAC.1